MQPGKRATGDHADEFATDTALSPLWPLLRSEQTAALKPGKALIETTRSEVAAYRARFFASVLRMQP